LHTQSRVNLRILTNQIIKKSILKAIKKIFLTIFLLFDICFLTVLNEFLLQFKQKYTFNNQKIECFNNFETQM